ncbi:MAG: hypothetical protein M3O15_02935 [Acidobacteriota bacterium]|nr:hypothetical protein [Acidobacteriota bacterium]
MAYTQEGIMAQVYVAFGQGTGPVRVSQDVCDELRKVYFPMTERALPLWETEAVQALERIRALGRLLAHKAIASGQTSITAANDVAEAVQMVKNESVRKVAGVSIQTAICGGPPPEVPQT